MIWFNERKRLEDRYYEWLLKNPGVKDCAFNVISFLCGIGEIKYWIPCNEKLPNFSPNKWRKVFVTLEDLNGRRFVTTAKYHEEFKWWYEFNDSRYYDFKVIAWMDKPLPYIGE